jgi:hypothetical protein
MTLERCETSWGARRGECAVWLNADTLCSRRLGHLTGDLPHRGYDPSGSGRWIDYDADGHEIARGPQGQW